MHFNLEILLVACLLALHSVSSAVITKREVKPSTENGESNQKALTVVPVNIARKKGDTVILPCKADKSQSKVDWLEYITDDKGKQISKNDDILLSHPNAGRYAIVKDSPSTFNLQISNLQLQDGGAYSCQARHAHNGKPPNTAQAEIVVLESDPICTSTLPSNGVVLEDKTHTISCRVRYGATKYLSRAPKMTWTGPSPFQISGVTSSTEVFSEVQFTIDRSMDTRSYQMRTNFTEFRSDDSSVATNAPEYDFFYRSTQLYVYWGPKKTYAVPVKSTYAVGDRIDCYSDSFPVSYYKWLNTRTGQQYPGRSYTIQESDVGHNTTFRCEAENIIQGIIYTDKIFMKLVVPGTA